MANISQIKKFTHVVTSAEAAAFTVIISFLWDSPFYDTNYVITWDVESNDTNLTQASERVAMASITPRGATLSVFTSAPAGTVLTFYVVASHR